MQMSLFIGEISAITVGNYATRVAIKLASAALDKVTTNINHLNIGFVSQGSQGQSVLMSPVVSIKTSLVLMALNFEQK